MAPFDTVGQCQLIIVITYIVVRFANKEGKNEKGQRRAALININVNLSENALYSAKSRILMSFPEINRISSKYGNTTAQKPNM